MGNKKVVMILQATTGKTQKEISEEYSKATAKLILEGYKVYNPSFVWNEEKLKQNGIKNIELYKISKELDAISKCDAIYFCDNWESEYSCHWLLFMAIACEVEILNKEMLGR